MTRLQRNANIGAVIVPFVAVLAAIPLLWNQLVGPDRPGDHGRRSTWPRAFGITIGFHRLLTHRAFETYRPLKYLFAVLGSMAVQGPVIDWVADHRKHHAHTDEEGDPHSPHVGHGSGLRRPVARPRGLAVGEQRHRRRQEVRARPARGPRACASSAATSCWWVALGLAIPFGLGLRHHRHARRRPAGAVLGRPGAGLLRAPHHLVDQLGLPLLRPPPVRDRRQVDQRLLAGPALAGRGLAPQPPRLPARRGPGPALVGDRPLRPGDPRDEAGCDLAWNVVRITPERQQQRLASPARRSPPRRRAGARRSG